MSTQNQLRHSFLWWCLALLIAVDAGLLTAHHRVTRALANVEMGQFFRNVHGDTSLTRPVGFSEDGQLSAAARSQEPDNGIVIRFASRNCHFCQQDQPLWSVVARRALQDHYQVIIVTPTVGAEYSPPTLNPSNAKQLTFVNLQWLYNLHLRATPTTLIADNRKHFLWGHEGALTNGDVKAAVDSMEKGR